MSERVQLRMPARPEYLVLARLVLAGIARCRPIAAEDLADLKLAVTEACSNSMRHAYAEAGGEVEITYRIDDGAIVVEVVDAGHGFAHDGGRDAQAELDGEGGLGLAIVEALTDEVEIGPRADGGSRVAFRKVLDPMIREEP
jgi:serine/threonine-protein kinase RsbW